MYGVLSLVFSSRAEGERRFKTKADPQEWLNEASNLNEFAIKLKSLTKDTFQINMSILKS